MAIFCSKIILPKNSAKYVPNYAKNPHQTPRWRTNKRFSKPKKWLKRLTIKMKGAIFLFLIFVQKKCSR